MEEINSCLGVQPHVQNSQTIYYVVSFSNSTNTFALKLSIKLQETNFLIWNQQVDEVTLSHELQRWEVHPKIPPMFKNEQDRIENIISWEYETWIMQDQTLFAWLLSTIYESVLPKVLACKCAYEVWDKVHKHFNSQMKARVHHICSELKISKKGTISISEYVLRVCAIADSLVAIGDPISKYG